MSDLVNQPSGCGLSEREQAMLDFEATWRQGRNPKGDRIRADFGLSEPHYYQIVNALIDRPEALAYAPAVVHRLRRLRDQRKAERAAGQVAPLR